MSSTIHQHRAVVPGRGRTRQRGVSLLELIAGLAIIAIIIIGALALVSQADASAKSSELLRGLAAVRAGTIAATTSEAGYGGIGTSLNTPLIRSRRVPDNWTTPGNVTDIRHGYGGLVNVTSQGVTFNVELTLIPDEACIQLISQQAGTSWSQVTVNGTAVTFPTTLALTTNACAVGNNNILVFSSAS